MYKTAKDNRILITEKDKIISQIMVTKQCNCGHLLTAVLTAIHMLSCIDTIR